MSCHEFSFTFFLYRIFAYDANDISMNIQTNNVDIYLNGHDHCLQHIRSIDRYFIKNPYYETVLIYIN